MKWRRSNTKFYYDKWLLVSALLVIVLGLIMVASASMVVSDQQFGYPFHFFIRQFIYFILGLILAKFALRFDMAFWQRMGVPLLVVGFALLFLVLVPGIGREVNGSKRWINLGIVTLQVSEAIKFCIIIYLAGYLLRHTQEIRTHVSGFIKPMLLLAVVSGFLMLEPDFGATGVLMATALTMMFMAGVRLWQFALLFILVVLALVVLAFSAPYRVARLITYMHPWAHAYGSGYQLTQSLIAFGRGGIFGVGLGNSIQKLFYLPEAHTDFLFAVLAEELGLLGELAVIFLFCILVTRALKIARNAQKIGHLFSAYVAYGFSVWLAMQAAINICVNSGLLPTKGLTLPLMSYGGSSLLVNCIMLAVLLRIHHETCMVAVYGSQFVRKRKAKLVTT